MNIALALLSFMEYSGSAWHFDPGFKQDYSTTTHADDYAINKVK